MNLKDILCLIGLIISCIGVVLCERAHALCCEHAIENKCRKACLRSHPGELLASNCEESIEGDFIRCRRRHLERARCCEANHNLTEACRSSCENVFSRTTFRLKDSLYDVKQICPLSTFRCAKSYFTEITSHSTEGSICCNRATSEQCKADCNRIVRLQITEEQKIDEIIKSCGDPVPRKPLWKCLLSNSGQESSSSPPNVRPHSYCCSKALSSNCKKLCRDLYSGPWKSSQTWQNFRKWCELDSEESSLNSCLQEVQQPCKMGCDDLEFCTNMNDRPSESFHSCNALSDNTARALMTQWRSGIIELEFADIPVVDIDACQPDKWKAVACILEIKPCGVKKGGTTICRDQCLSLLNECADVARFEKGLTVEWICDMFSPGHLQQDCISLDTYTVAENSKPEGVITQPCIPNPCASNEMCVVNREGCDRGNKCQAYKCLPACSVGHVETFLTYAGQRVKLRDFERGEGCFRACACTSAGKFEYCSNLPCMDQSKNCEVAGQIKAHGDNFKIDCNFCSCYNGEVTCTKRQCAWENDFSKVGMSTVLPCNCKPHHLPVCASNGRTYPNICLAKCMGFTETEIEFGPCSAKNPCKTRPCRRSERCIPANRVCLTSSTFGCPQFECLARYSHCMRRRRKRQSYASDGHHHIDSYLLNSANRRKASASLLFGYDLIWSNKQPICDKNGIEYTNICHLRRKYDNSTALAYRGKCKSQCKSGKRYHVCGTDGVTYENMCVSQAARIIIDYEGPCQFGKKRKSGGENECAEVSCAPLAHPDCVTVLPPGSCCRICGGMIRLLYSQRRLDSAAESSIHGPVSIRDVIRSMRRHTDVKECDIYGHSTIEGDIAMLVISTEKKPTSLQIEVCQQEAVRLGRLVNEQTPILHSDLILSTLTAAEVHGTKDGNKASSTYAYNSLTILCAIVVIKLYG